MSPRLGDRGFNDAIVREIAAIIGAVAARLLSSVGIIASVKSRSAATGKTKCLELNRNGAKGSYMSHKNN